MNKDQIKECHASGYIKIGSHGLNHQHLPQLDDDTLCSEVAHSKQILEHLIGDRIYSFAYPYGEYTFREVEEVKRAGYQFGVGTVSGPVHMGDDLMRIRRIIIFPSSRKFDFWKKSSGFYLRYCRLKGKDF